MHEVATRQYIPNSYDEARGLGTNFGTTTMIINGGIECDTDDGRESAGSYARMGYYRKQLNFFSLPEEKDLSCAEI